MSRPKTNRSIRRGQMRSQLIGQNFPNKEASKVRRNSEKQQKQENKKKNKKKNGGRESRTGRNCSKSDGGDQNWTVASKPVGKLIN